MRTRAVHAGEPRPLVDGAISLPIFQTSTYLLGDSEDYHDIRYMRLNNSPNHVALGEKLAALEGTEAAVVAASGMAAISTALFSVLPDGSHLLAQDNLYGGTLEFLKELERSRRVSTSFVSLEEADSWHRALRPETRAFYVESLTNPLLQVGRLDEAAYFARSHGIVSLIDNTFPSPVNFRPAEMGFDLVLHSATKYLNGHSDVVAGVVAGSAARVKDVLHLLNILGGTLDTHACFLLHRGLKTLPIRVRAQSETALAVAHFLAQSPAVERVYYPGLEADPSYARARAWFAAAGGMVSFLPRGGRQAADAILARFELPMVAPSLGGTETLVIRPASSSHAALGPEGRKKMGIEEGLIRVSVGLEDVEDLLADFEQALRGQ